MVKERIILSLADSNFQLHLFNQPGLTLEKAKEAIKAHEISIQQVRIIQNGNAS